MVLIVHFGRVLDQQHLLVLAHSLARLLDMRAHQLLIADLRRLQETISAVQGRLTSHLLGQGGRRVSSNGRRHLHRALAATAMTQAYLPKGLLCPLWGTQQGARLHPLSPFACLDSFLMDSITNSHPKLWLKVRMKGRVSPRGTRHRQVAYAYINPHHLLVGLWCWVGYLYLK